MHLLSIPRWRVWLAAIAMLIALLADVPARADDVSKLALVRQLMAVTGISKSVEPMIGPVGKLIEDKFVQRHPDQASVIGPIVRRASENAMRRLLPPMELAAPQLWVTMFDEQELADALAFYRSPTGARMLAKMPELTLAILRIAMPLGEMAAHEMADEVRRELVARGIEKAP